MSIVSQVCALTNSKGKPGWWRYVLSRALEVGELSNVDYDSAYTLAKMEFGLDIMSQNYSVLTQNVNAIGYQDEEEETKLVSIGNVLNVSTLAPEKKIDFSLTGLTVIYGNNGAGKSSYTKILKNSCLTRGEAPVLRNNIFESNIGIPSAEIEIKTNGVDDLIVWNSQLEPDQRLKSIRVFDSLSSIHYLSKADNLDYKPPALKLLDELVKVSEFIADKAKKEESAYIAINILPAMHIGTTPSKLQITSNLRQEDVDSLCATQEDLSELQELRKEVLELNNNSPETLKARFQKRRLRAIPLQSFLQNLVDKLNQESMKLYKALNDKKEQAKQAASNLANVTFTDLPIANIGSEQWLIMWNAARNFIHSIEQSKSFPPVAGDNCPTCLQEIDASTALRLSSFNEYLNSALQKEADIALDAWNAEVKKIRQLVFLTTPYDAILNEIKEKNEELGLQFYSLIRVLKERADNLLKEAPQIPLDEIDISALTRLNSDIKKLEDTEKAVLNDEAKAVAIRTKQLRINEIEDREKISLIKNQIINEIDKAKKRDLYSKIKDSTSTAAITRLSSEICNSGSIGRMQSLFNIELMKLGFNHFKIEAITKGTKGNQKFNIQLANSRANIVDIASEGEQKCISLASFFAELATDDRKSAIIFDDPVNSLDHIWRLKFAQRIVDESKTRQVIVFTHDLPFMKMMQEASENLTVKALTRNKNTTGIPLDSPPWDALKTVARVGILKNELIQARKAADKSILEYQTAAGSIYGKMRETWERLIEEWLIRGVVERFNREIKTQNCRYLVDISDEDVRTIDSAMSKCSTYMHGHDMAEEVTGAFPDIDELAQDVAALEMYLGKLKKRRA